MGLRDEILEQPAAAERQLASSPDVIAALAGRLRAEPVDLVVIAARGTSDHAAIYAQYLLGTVHRLPVALAAPSIVSLYGVVPRFARALVVGISQSGASPDIVGVVEAGRSQDVPTLAITNDPASPLAAAAEYVIDLAAGPERAVAATKTYSTSLLAIARLSAALGVPVTSFFRGLDEERDVLFVKAGQGLDITHKGARAGHRYQMLGSMRGPHKRMEPVLVTLRERSEVFPLYQHAGTELLYLLSGAMDYSYGNATYTLEPGDTLQFNGEVTHGPKRLVRLPVQVLSVKAYGASPVTP